MLLVKICLFFWKAIGLYGSRTLKSFDSVMPLLGVCPLKVVGNLDKLLSADLVIITLLQ